MKGNNRIGTLGMIAGLLLALLIAWPTPGGSSALAPPTAEERQAWTQTERFMGARPVAGCPDGYVIMVGYGFAENPTDQEWAMILIAERTAPLWVIHFGAGPTGRAEHAWIDQDGDGVYERVLEGAEAIVAEAKQTDWCQRALAPTKED